MEAIQTRQMGQKLKKLIHKYPFLPVFIFAFMSQVTIFKKFIKIPVFLKTTYKPSIYGPYF